MKADILLFLLGVKEAGTRRSVSAKELRSTDYSQLKTPSDSSARVSEIVRRRGASDIPKLNYSCFDQTNQPKSNLENIVEEPPATSKKAKKVKCHIWFSDRD